MPKIISKPVAPASANPTQVCVTTRAQVRANATYQRLMRALSVNRRVIKLLNAGELS